MQAPTQSGPSSPSATSYGVYQPREPPPYPGQNQRNWFQPGLRQSYSGSEASTDISLSSTESLSCRQEPQGQETSSLVSTPIDSIDGDNPFADYLHEQLASSPGGLEQLKGTSATFYIGGSSGSSMGGGGLSTSQSGVGCAELEVPTAGRSSRGSSPQGSTGTRTPPSYAQGQRNPSPNLSQQPPPAMLTNVSTTEAVTVTSANYQSPLPPGPILVPPSQGQGHQGQGHSPQNVPTGTTLQVPSVSPNISPQGSYKSSPTGSLHGQPPTDVLSLSPAQLQELMMLQHNHDLQTKGQAAYNSGSHSPRMGVTVTKVKDQGSQGQQGFVRSPNNSIRSTKSASPSPIPQRTETPQPTPKTHRSQRPSTAPSQRPAPAQMPSSSREYHGVPAATRPTTLEATRGSSATHGLRRSYEMLDKLPHTHSHPDLTRLIQGDTATTTALQQTTQQQTTTQQQQQQAAAAAAEMVTTSVSPQPTTMQIMQLQQQQHQQMQQQHLFSHQLMVQQQHQASTPQSKKKLPDLDHAAIATRATQMVERLSQENLSLRKELQSYYNKVCKLQKFENEIEKVHEAYESLVKHSQKRESLEKAMRCKLEASVNSLKHNNQLIKDQLDKAVQQLSNRELYSDKLSDSEAKQELQRKDTMLNKLISQNRDLLLAKERLQLEVATLRSTTQEQRAQISILDSALTYAQTNVLKYEEEQQRRRTEEEKVAELQKALSQLQTVTDKRQGIEQQLCAKLQEEIQTLKGQQQAGVSSSASTSSMSGVAVRSQCDTDEGISSDSESPTSVQSLIQHMQEKEQRVLELEAQVLKWEQKYLEETALRQLAVDVASMPKDARIAALEQSSLATEKIVADARTEKLKHLEEVYQANRRVAEMEAKLCSLQAQLAEKDAMIRVLQRHPTLSRTSSIASLFSSPVHSPHQSIISSSPHQSILQSSSSPVYSASPLSLSPIPSTPFTAFSAPGSGASSRQNSQLDSNTLPTFSSGSSTYSNSGIEPHSKATSHHKSNSIGSSGVASSSSVHNATNSPSLSSSRETQWKELQQKLAAQAALFGTLQSGSEQLKRCFWQV